MPATKKKEPTYKLSFFFDFEMDGHTYIAGTPLDDKESIHIKNYETLIKYSDPQDYIINPDLHEAKKYFEGNKDRILQSLEDKQIKFTFS